MTGTKTLLFLFAIFFLKQFCAQTSVASGAADTSDHSFLRQEITRLLSIKEQFPDSFRAERLYARLAMGYFLISDTVNFIHTTNEILSSDIKRYSRDNSDDFLRSTLTRQLLYIYKAKRDTLKLIETAGKRLFIFNKVACATGEKEFRLGLFDILINCYNSRGQADKVRDLKARRQKYAGKNKLNKPRYL